MGRKYLDELPNNRTIEEQVGDNDERASGWAAEREEFGFDSRQTWALDSAMLELLYERLIMYREKAKEVVNLTWRSHDVSSIPKIGKKEMNQLEIIDAMIAHAKIGLNDEADTLEEEAEIMYSVKTVWELWAVIHPHMWW